MDAVRWNNIRYGIFALIYDWALQWFYQPRVQRLISLVNMQPGSRVLEVGVGTGFTIPFYSKNKQVTAIDCSLPMLEKARQKAERNPHLQVDLVHASAESFLLEDGFFDHIIFCNSISVIQNPEQVLSAYFERLRDNGSLYILNHFTPERGLLRHFDRLWAPVGKLLGFKSYFPLRQVANPSTMPHLTVAQSGYWSIVMIKKQPTL